MKSLRLGSTLGQVAVEALHQLRGGLIIDRPQASNGGGYVGLEGQSCKPIGRIRVSQSGLTGTENNQIRIGSIPVDGIEGVEGQFLIPQLDVGRFNLPGQEQCCGSHDAAVDQAIAESLLELQNRLQWKLLSRAMLSVARGV